MFIYTETTAIILVQNSELPKNKPKSYLLDYETYIIEKLTFRLKVNFWQKITIYALTLRDLTVVSKISPQK